MHLLYRKYGIPVKIAARQVIIDEIEGITVRNPDEHKELPVDE